MGYFLEFFGGPEFFGVVKGGTSFFFCGSKGEGPEFFESHSGGPECFPRNGTSNLLFLLQLVSLIHLMARKVS